MNTTNVKCGNQNPDSVMFNTYSVPFGNQFTNFKNKLNYEYDYYWTRNDGFDSWEINNNWDVTFETPRRLRIDKFQIDTWGLRQKHNTTKDANTLKGYANTEMRQFTEHLSVRVSGLDYVHKNIICANPDNLNEVTGFVPAYAAKWIPVWYPGRFDSTNGYNYIRGLVFQGCGVYKENWNNRGDASYSMCANADGDEIDLNRDDFVRDGIRPTGMIYANSYAISIGLFGGCQNATSHLDTANGAYRIYDISDHPIYIELDVPSSEEPVDPSSTECWDINLGSTNIYHKDKTFENCWKKYGLISQPDPSSNYMTVTKTPVIQFPNPLRLPAITDLEDYIQVETDDKLDVVRFLKWNISLADESDWKDIEDWFATHDYNIMSLTNSSFKNCNMENLTLRLRYPYKSQISKQRCFEYSTIKHMTLDIPDNINILGIEFFYRMTNLQSIALTGSQGLSCKDLAGCFAFCSSLPTYPANLFDFTKNQDYFISGCVHMQYFLDYANMQSVPVSSYANGDRYAAQNTIYVAPFCQQMLNCGISLTYFGPVLDMRYVRPSGANKSFRCDSLTDIRIKNLNHGDWDFVNANYLPKPDAESLKYLFDNLTDLNTYDVNNVNSVTTNFENWNIISSTVSLGHVLRIDPKNYNNITIVSTTETFDNFNVYVENMQSGDKIIFCRETEITENGEYALPKTTTENLGFYFTTTNPTAREKTVNITILNAYQPQLPDVDHANLYCPSEWSDKITADMIASAKSKNWTIYINNVQQ